MPSRLVAFPYHLILTANYGYWQRISFVRDSPVVVPILRTLAGQPGHVLGFAPSMPAVCDGG